MTATTRTLLFASVSLVCIYAAAHAYLRHKYPYGMRGGILPQMSIALRLYAHDHGGRFPTANGGPLESLSLLYPDYLGLPLPLAGLSGHIDKVTEKVRTGRPLTPDDSSWEYVPGLLSSTNASQRVLLWERRPGIGFTGRRNTETDGRAVLFCDGAMRFVPGWQWAEIAEGLGVSP